MSKKVSLPDFQDGKSPDALRTIGEVAKAFNLRQHVLRYWEEQFPMLQPLTRAGGRRYYRPEDIALIAEISRLLYQEGFTIRGARQALSGRPQQNSASAADLAEEAIALGQGIPSAEGKALSTPVRAAVGAMMDPGLALTASDAGNPAVAQGERRNAADRRLLEQLISLREHFARALEI